MGVITQMCGVVICLVLALFYTQQRKLQLETQNAFVRVWQMVLLGLVLDISSIYMLRYKAFFTHAFAMIVCNAYLLTILWKQVFGILYIDTYISEKHKFKQKETWFYLLYGIGGSIIIILTPISGMMDRGSSGYHYGLATIIAYVLAILLLIRMIILIIQHRRQMTKISRWSASVWIIICLTAIVAQFINNELMIAGFFSAVGIMIIYLKLENPERFIDSDTGFFNQLAFKRYINEIEENETHVSMLYVDYEQVGYQFTDIDKEVRLEVCNFFDGMKKIYPFRGSEESIILVIPNREDVLGTVESIKNRFVKPWGKHKDTFLKTKMIYLEDVFSLKKPSHVKHIFNYVRYDKRMFDEENFVIIDENVIQDAYREDDVEEMIWDSIENQKVEVFYQPIYSTESKTFVSAEALVRIRKDDGGLIFPGEFIEVAEKRGSILQLGAQVFDQVCGFIEDHNMDKIGLHYIEVNLSAVQFGYQNLAHDLIETMEYHHVAPKYINLEITESAALGNDKVFLDNLYALKDYGVTFSLDDFGTGQSNLNYIVAMPVDIVKFDRGMTLSYFESEKAKHVMDAAMMMIKGMDLKIVSEGIESQEQLEVMEELGIQYIQGYFFSKPLPVRKFIEFIAAAIEEKEEFVEIADGVVKL